MHKTRISIGIQMHRTGYTYTLRRITSIVRNTNVKPQALARRFSKLVTKQLSNNTSLCYLGIVLNLCSYTLTLLSTYNAQSYTLLTLLSIAIIVDVIGSRCHHGHVHKDVGDNQQVASSWSYYNYQACWTQEAIH